MKGKQVEALLKKERQRILSEVRGCGSVISGEEEYLNCDFSKLHKILHLEPGS